MVTPRVYLISTLKINMLCDNSIKLPQLHKKHTKSYYVKENKNITAETSMSIVSSGDSDQV